LSNLADDHRYPYGINGSGTAWLRRYPAACPDALMDVATPFFLAKTCILPFFREKGTIVLCAHHDAFIIESIRTKSLADVSHLSGRPEKRRDTPVEFRETGDLSHLVNTFRVAVYAARKHAQISHAIGRRGRRAASRARPS
jgi:hypothetical protein